MLLSRASKLNEKIYVEGLTVAGTKRELRKDLCPPLLHHLFPPKTARRERGPSTDHPVVPSRSVVSSVSLDSRTHLS